MPLAGRGTRARPRRRRCASARRRSPRSRPLPAWRDTRLLRARRPRSRPTARRLRRISAGTSPRTTTSETANRPPGFSTRNASRSTRSLSAERLMTQLEMMTSTESSGSGMLSISPFRNSTLFDAGLALVLARQRQHLVGHVEAVGLAGRADAPRRQQHVDAAARAEVEHDLARLQLGERRRVAAAERRGHRFRRQLGGLAVGVELGGDRIAALLRSRRCRSTRLSPLLTRRAAWPYFCFTSSLMLSSAIARPPQHQDPLMVSVKKGASSQRGDMSRSPFRGFLMASSACIISSSTSRFSV